MSLDNPQLWVAVAFLVFFGLAGKKIFRALTGALDKRSHQIAAELGEAKRLREEAEATLAAYKKKQKEALTEAEEILAKAKQDAEALTRQAEIELKTALERRTRLAMDRIEQEERHAVEDVKSHVVDITVAAARAMVAEQVKKTSGEDLVRLALRDIERKVH